MTKIIYAECFNFICGEFYNDSANNGLGCPRAYLNGDHVIFTWSEYILECLEDAEYCVHKMPILEAVARLEDYYKARLERAESKIISLKRK